MLVNFQLKGAEIPDVLPESLIPKKDTELPAISEEVVLFIFDAFLHDRWRKNIGTCFQSLTWTERE